MKLLSVIISTKDRKEILSETLSHITNNVSFDAREMEFIVVNDGDENIPEQILPKELNPRVINLKQKSLAKARNAGAKNSNGKIILFLDDDILPSKDHFYRHLQIQEKFPFAIITANRFFPKELILKAKETPFSRYKIKYEYDWTSETAMSSIENNPDLYNAENLAGFSCSMPKEVWAKLEGFNEHFTDAGCEDSEFFYRANKLGIQLIFDKSNHCFHNENDNFSLKNWLRRQGTGARGAVVICELHPEGKTHPSYVLNTPISFKNDSFNTFFIKTKRWILMNRIIFKILYILTSVCEKIKIPDAVLFKLYNALWISNSTYFFRIKWKQIKSNPINNCIL